MTKDMTSGNPLKLIIGFAIPMFLGMLFQQFYSMVDTVIVGKFLGVGPLAGVGSTSSLNFLVIGSVPVSAMVLRYRFHRCSVQKEIRSCDVL